MLENKKMLRTPTSWARAIATTLEEYEVDVQSLFAKVNMDYELLHDSRAYYWQDSITQLWEAAVKLTGDPNFGLNVGLHIHAHTYPAVGYSLISCKNLKASLERLVRYKKMLAEGFEFDFQQEGSMYRLSFDIQASTRPPTEQAMDATITSFLNFIGWATQNTVHPKKALLARSTPADTSLFERVFSCPIQYQAGVNQLYFLVQDISAPLMTANEEISKLHDANANRLLVQMRRGDISRQVRDFIIQNLPSGEPKLELIAQELSMSSSTLKRRLRSENTSFKSLLEEIREELAVTYLRDKSYTLTQITFLLGFSENSAFNRAFKRWKGCSPTKWQEQKN